MFIFAHKLHIINPQSKILVTGGTGFLGAYIIKQLLADGFAVRAIKRANSTLPFFIDKDILNKAEWVEGDILDVTSLENAMQDIDTVIHSAAVVSFAKKERNKMYHVNIEGTANVVNIALQKNIRRFVYISSVAALGRKKDSSRVDETAKWEENPVNTHYAITKYKAELEVWRGFAEGLEGVILNPATILGYGDWRGGSNAIFKNVYDEFGWYTNGINGFTDVEDVARATVLLMKTNITEQRYIICNDNWSFKKLFDTMADNFNKKRPSKEATPFLSGIAWRLEWLKSLFNGKSPLVTKESAKVAISETFFDSDKLLKALPGFSLTPLEDTIARAGKKYRELALK